MFKSFSKCLLVISSHHISNHCLHCWPGSNTKSPAGLRFSAPRNNIISASPSHPNTNKTWNTWNQPPKILHDFSKPSSLRKAFVAPSSWALNGFKIWPPGGVLFSFSPQDAEFLVAIQKLGSTWNPWKLENVILVVIGILGGASEFPFQRPKVFSECSLLPSAIHRIVVHNPGSRKQEEI